MEFHLWHLDLRHVQPPTRPDPGPAVDALGAGDPGSQKLASNSSNRFSICPKQAQISQMVNPEEFHQPRLAPYTHGSAWESQHDVIDRIIMIIPPATCIILPIDPGISTLNGNTTDAILQSPVHVADPYLRTWSFIYDILMVSTDLDATCGS